MTDKAPLARVVRLASSLDTVTAVSLAAGLPQPDARLASLLSACRARAGWLGRAEEAEELEAWVLGVVGIAADRGLAGPVSAVGGAAAYAMAARALAGAAVAASLGPWAPRDAVEGLLAPVLAVADGAIVVTPSTLGGAR